LFIISSSLATCLGAKFHNIIECGWIYWNKICTIFQRCISGVLG
jgi:hypothetical protein